MVINLEKGIFAVEAFEFLGHLVSAEGARPLTSYVEAVEKRPPPSTVKKLQVFLGLINFYRRFLPGVAVTLRLLTDALRGNRPAGERLDWSPEMEAGFVGAKAALSRATWLGHPDPAAQLALHVDASSSHVGAALHQQPKGSVGWQPLGFFSRKLESAQAKWSAFDRELYACVEGIHHFRFILEGRSFTIYTDHKPLVGGIGSSLRSVDGSPVSPLGLRGRVHGGHPARGRPGQRGGRCTVEAAGLLHHYAFFFIACGG